MRRAVFSTSQSFGGEQKEMLTDSYKECDKLLVIPSAGEGVHIFYKSAGEVGECKNNKHREIYLGKKERNWFMSRPTMVTIAALHNTGLIYSLGRTSVSSGMSRAGSWGSQ